MAEKTLTETEQRILDAAREQFHQKGFAGSRMQEIADQAGINKAMLHYYYRSKDQLFDAVFQQDIQTFLPEIIQILTSDVPLFDKIRWFADRYITLIQQHPFLPGFIVNELSQNPDRMVNMVTSLDAFKPERFFDQVREEVKAKRIKEIDPHQLLVNMVSMCLFPFIGKPMMQAILSLDEKGFDDFLESRKTEVPKFVIESISVNN